MSETQSKKASLTMWTESRREAQHWIPPGHGKGGKGHSQQCPASTGIFPEGKAPLQLHNTSLSAWCGPQNHLPLFTKGTPCSWYPSTLCFMLVQEEHKYHLGGYLESRGLPWRISGKKSAQQIQPELCAAAGQCNKDEFPQALGPVTSDLCLWTSAQK